MQRETINQRQEGFPQFSLNSFSDHRCYEANDVISRRSNHELTIGFPEEDQLQQPCTAVVKLECFRAKMQQQRYYYLLSVGVGRGARNLSIIRDQSDG